MRVSNPRPSIFSNQKIIFAVLIASAIVLSNATIYFVTTSRPTTHDNVALEGYVKIFIDGKMIYQADTINAFWFDHMSCFLFGVSGSCSFISSGSVFGASCSTASVTGCAATGIALSTDSTGVTQFSTCPSIITTNGLAPVGGTVGHTALSNAETVSATWTATATFTITKVCLLPTNAGTPVNNAGSALAIDLVSPSITINNGQTLQVQWTFTL